MRDRFILESENRELKARLRKLEAAAQECVEGHYYGPRRYCTECGHAGRHKDNCIVGALEAALKPVAMIFDGVLVDVLENAPWPKLANTAPETAILRKVIDARKSLAEDEGAPELNDRGRGQ